MAQSTTRTALVPEVLLPLEVERETLASVFRASMILEETPDNATAREALEDVLFMPTAHFGYPDHQVIHRAMVAVCGVKGQAVTPGLVVQHLRKVGQLGDRGALVAGILGYGVAPIAGVRRHIATIEHFARERAEFVACRNRQAEILGNR